MISLLLKVDPVEEELLYGGVVHVDVAGEHFEVCKYLWFCDRGTFALNHDQLLVGRQVEEKVL